MIKNALKAKRFESPSSQKLLNVSWIQHKQQIFFRKVIFLNLISPTQRGFQKGKSTDTALLQFYDYVSGCNDERFVVDAIFFDF